MDEDVRHAFMVLLSLWERDVLAFPFQCGLLLIMPADTSYPYVKPPHQEIKTRLYRY